MTIMLTVLVSTVSADMVVLAGSTMESPPPFWEDSFWGLTSNIERAYRFELESSIPHYAKELQIAAYHYENMPGSSANFSINLDDDGEPGQAIGEFNITGITTTQQILSAKVNEETVLHSGAAYWLLGGTSHGQVNWNLGDMAFTQEAGNYAYRVISEGDWIVSESSRSNISAYAILGTQVPEPATVALLGLGGLVVLRKRRGTFLSKK